MSVFNNDSELIRAYLKSVADKIRQESIAQGRVATGKTIASLSVLATSATGGQIRANENILNTEFGTSPEEAQAVEYPTLVEQLKEWISAKGLDLNPYALAHVLRKQGSKLYREGGHSGVLTNFIDEKKLDDFTESLSAKYLQETRSLLFD
ncbi:hypothetical protein BCY91_14105 [Pelobium manganitolerans]|uniref:Uncharacterized protein n=1 Tax=Pelobium manganitolerans TaxID=1842495 RepID=A0A419S9Z4_9SPHI|nr:hypothetical protein [Pelobium manganitolerans]RKD19006.1 hypothetical protein BCY91_14105 [Pelobium manganitolerans]